MQQGHEKPKITAKKGTIMEWPLETWSVCLRLEAPNTSGCWLQWRLKPPEATQLGKIQCSWAEQGWDIPKNFENVAWSWNGHWKPEVFAARNAPKQQTLQVLGCLGGRTLWKPTQAGKIQCFWALWMWIIQKEWEQLLAHEMATGNLKCLRLKVPRSIKPLIGLSKLKKV